MIPEDVVIWPPPTLERLPPELRRLLGSKNATPSGVDALETRLRQSLVVAGRATTVTKASKPLTRSDLVKLKVTKLLPRLASRTWVHILVVNGRACWVMLRSGICGMSSIGQGCQLRAEKRSLYNTHWKRLAAYQSRSHAIARGLVRHL